LSVLQDDSGPQKSKHSSIQFAAPPLSKNVLQSVELELIGPKSVSQAEQLVQAPEVFEI